jgi:CubicO group peptidase (beta-lactamase class C family)
MRLPVLFLSLAMLNSAWAQTDAVKKLDSLFAPAVNSKKPGGVIYVMQGDDVIYKKAIGLADMAKGTPNSFELKYDLASIAKQFTGMCIALLEEQGKISAEDPLRKFYPEFRLPETIKIKNLIDHTSGIREAYVLATLSGKTNLKGELRKSANTKEYLLGVLQKERDLNFESGSELAYTNINYILLADIVERISKQPFHRFADSAIFKPLKMTNTFYRHQYDQQFPGEAKGYLVIGPNRFKPRKATGGILGDGKMVTTIDDLVKWEQNLRHNTLGMKKQTLVDKLYTSSKLNNGELTQYGYGFWNREYRGLKTISHGGDDGRFTSFILKFPERELAIICLANSSLYYNTESTAYQVANIVLEKSLKPEEKPREYNYIELPKEKLQTWVGNYGSIDDKGLARFRKIAVRDHLYASASYYSEGTLMKPVEEKVFILTNRSGTQVQFTFGKNKNGHFFDEKYQNESPWHFEQIQPQKFVPRNFKGVYLNTTTGARLKVKAKGDKLLAKKGIIRIPLIDFGPDQFYATQNDALFIFQRDANRKIISLKVNAADFRNFIFEKVK